MRPNVNVKPKRKPIFASSPLKGLLSSKQDGLQIKAAPHFGIFFGGGGRRKMLLSVSGKTTVCKFPHDFFTKKSQKSTKISARKQDFPQNSETGKKSLIESKFSNRILAQSATAVLGLGFVDAGYDTTSTLYVPA